MQKFDGFCKNTFSRKNIQYSQKLKMSPVSPGQDETRKCIYPSFLLSGHFHRIIPLVFKKFTWLQKPIQSCVTEPDFPDKKFLRPKLGKWTRNGTKTRFFEFIEKILSLILLNLVYNENLFYLFCSSTNPIFM